MLRALKYAAMFDVVIAQHCQDNKVAGSGVMNAGYYSTILGLPGTDALAEEMMLWRDIQLVKKVCCGTGFQPVKTQPGWPCHIRYHAQHISTAGSVELIRAAKKDSLPITCEVTPHNLLLTEKCCAEYDTNYKVNPPLRTDKDIDALKQAISEGLVDALVTDHAPHLQSEKELEFLAAPFGIASLECALGLYVKALVEPGVLDWPRLIELMTARPAKIIGVDKGTLGKGKQGDVTIIDPNAEYKVDVNKFRSKSRNCPYHGWMLKGKVEKTIVGGEIRFSADS
jgi:dihydroorotase